LLLSDDGASLLGVEGGDELCGEEWDEEMEDVSVMLVVEGEDEGGVRRRCPRRETTVQGAELFAFANSSFLPE
jgi:hypothetical protein